MSDFTRRNLLRATGAAAAAALPAPAQHALHAATPAVPHQAERFLAPEEFRTLQVLCELIIPADERSPGATEAGAAEYIDLLAGGNSKIAVIFRGGLAWLNAKSRELYGRPFAESDGSGQVKLLETIAYRESVTPDLRYGAIFFDWARRLTLDAYYTSKAGIADIGYQGNKGMSEFQVPAEAVRQALKKIEGG